MRQFKDTKPPKPAHDAQYGEKVAWLLQCYALNPATNRVVDLYADAPPYEFSFDGFKNTFAHLFEMRMVNGRFRKVRAIDDWLEGEPTIVAGCAMRPDQDFPGFTENGSAWKNTFRPFTWDPVPLIKVKPFLRYIRRVIPDPAQCGYFLDCIAHKLRHPDVPGPSVIMVAVDEDGKPLHGTGRGTLYDILQRLFRHRYVKSIPFETFAGLSSQTQFTASWQANSLFVCVNEAKSVDPNANTFSGRRGIYENVKGIVDPAKRLVMLTDKKIPYFDSWVFCSFLIFSNHKDALQLPPDDERRFFVLSNGRKQTEAEGVAINRWKDEDDNIGALWRWLDMRNLGAFNPYAPPPVTQSKTDMQQMTKTEMEMAFDLAEQYMPGVAFHSAQLRSWVGFFLDDQTLMRGGAFSAVKRIRAQAVMAGPEFKRQRQIRMTGRLDYPKPVLAFNRDRKRVEAFTIDELRDEMRRNNATPSATPRLRAIIGGKAEPQNKTSDEPLNDEF